MFTIFGEGFNLIECNILGCVQWKAQRDSASIRDHQQKDVAHIVNFDVKFGELFRAHAVAGSVG